MHVIGELPTTIYLCKLLQQVWEELDLKLNINALLESHVKMKKAPSGARSKRKRRNVRKQVSGRNAWRLATNVIETIEWGTFVYGINSFTWFFYFYISLFRLVNINYQIRSKLWKVYVSSKFVTMIWKYRNLADWHFLFFVCLVSRHELLY